MSKILYIESDSSLHIENGLKIIESLSGKTEDKSDDKINNIDNSILSLSGIKTRKYEATLTVSIILIGITITLSIDGGKTFYGTGAGVGIIGDGNYSGSFYIFEDDIDEFYEKAKSFTGNISSSYSSLSFYKSPIDALAKFKGRGSGNISTNIAGAGHWE